MNLKDFLFKYINVGDDYKEYSVKSYKEHPELKIVISKFLKKHEHKFSMKACFYNSALVMKADIRIGYCEGYTLLGLGDGIPIEHAWNVFVDNDGVEFYFDLTSELIFGGDIGKGSNEYTELYRTFDQLEAKKVVNGVIRPYMRKNKQLKREEAVLK